MKATTALFVMALGLAGTSLALAQKPPTEGPGVQAARDTREPAVLASCKNPPPPSRPFAGAPPAQPKIAAHPKVDAIPEVVAAGAKWKVIWQAKGNNADGIIGMPNGDILLAQNNNSDVIELTPKGKAKVVYQDTDTGGALSMNKQGQLFIDERGLRAAVWELSPQHRVLANRLQNGDSLDCLGGVLNDLTALSNGGVYFTQGGIYYAAPDGTVTPYGSHLQTNGIILSPDEKTLYVTSGGNLVALDVQQDGSLTNQRVLAKLPGGGGDGSTIDSQGRIYVTGYPGVRVIAPDGTVLGTIPAPMQLISVAFSGPDKKTLFAVGEKRGTQPGAAGIAAMVILTIPMSAQGYAERAK
jgi:gluconolactonase